MKKLFLIPARGGSKGLKNKNILYFDNKPLIIYTLDAALNSAEKDDVICVSSDDEKIIKVVKDHGIDVPFVRPDEFSTDFSKVSDVIHHALSWYKKKEINFDAVILLQPTSPLRKASHIKSALEIWNNDIEMIASVKETDSNPYYVLFEEDENSYLVKSKKSKFSRRQDCPSVFELNGAIYIINVKSFIEIGIENFSKIKKYLMPKRDSVDIDDIYDFKFAELIIKNEF